MGFSSLDSFAFTKGLETLVMSTKPVESEKKPDIKPPQPAKSESDIETPSAAETPKAESTVSKGRKRNESKDSGDAE